MGASRKAVLSRRLMSQSWHITRTYRSINSRDKLARPVKRTATRGVGFATGGCPPCVHAPASKVPGAALRPPTCHCRRGAAGGDGERAKNKNGGNNGREDLTGRGHMGWGQPCTLPRAVGWNASGHWKRRWADTSLHTTGTTFRGAAADGRSVPCTSRPRDRDSMLCNLIPKTLLGQSPPRPLDV